MTQNNANLDSPDAPDAPEDVKCKKNEKFPDFFRISFEKPGKIKFLTAFFKLFIEK